MSTTPKKSDITADWSLYEAGKNHNNSLSPAYYDTINKNERFWAGDQWKGVQSNGLPTPVFNLFKRIVNHFVATILGNKVEMNARSVDLSDDDDAISWLLSEATKFVNAEFDWLWERIKMDSLIRDILLDAALMGDACLFTYWDKSIKTRQDSQGGINCELVNPTNVFFGNANDIRVQKQPYIIISFRRLVEDVRREAKMFGMKESNLMRIMADSDTEYEAGDMAQNEVEGSDDETGKCTVILKMWKEYDIDGNVKVMMRKSTTGVVIRDTWDSKLTLYPISWMNWDRRKNSYHGQAMCTGLVPNQIFINKMFAFIMVSLMNTAFPRLVYDKSVISNPSNVVGASYGVNGDVTKAMTYLNGAQMGSNLMTVVDSVIKYTKDFLGASDAFMGDVRPENTSAIVAVSKNAMIPLDNIRQQLYQMIEDTGNIWTDHMRAHYRERRIVIETGGMKIAKKFDFSLLNSMDIGVHIDVGASSYWSEISTVQTLDNMLAQGMIDAEQYIELMPATILPGKDKLLTDVKSKDLKKQVLFGEMEKFVNNLPPEQQDKIRNMPKENVDNFILQLMLEQVQDQPLPGSQPQMPQEAQNATPQA